MGYFRGAFQVDEWAKKIVIALESTWPPELFHLDEPQSLRFLRSRQLKKVRCSYSGTKCQNFGWCIAEPNIYRLPMNTTTYFSITFSISLSWWIIQRKIAGYNQQAKRILFIIATFDLKSENLFNCRVSITNNGVPPPIHWITQWLRFKQDRQKIFAVKLHWSALPESAQN